MIIKYMLDKEPFWQYLDFTQQSLIKQSFFLLGLARENQDKLHDFSFVVMPAAKAYEGFLKKLFFDLNLVSKKDLEAEYFRVGKALNPELEHIKHLSKECLYDEISQRCSPELAEKLWQTWKRCRNQLFHYFPKEQQVFTLKEAEERLNTLIEAIKFAFGNCRA